MKMFSTGKKKCLIILVLTLATVVVPILGDAIAIADAVPEAESDREIDLKKRKVPGFIKKSASL